MGQAFWKRRRPTRPERIGGQSQAHPELPLPNLQNLQWADSAEGARDVAKAPTSAVRGASVTLVSADEHSM